MEERRHANDARLDRLEGVVEHLAKSQASMEATMAALSRNVDHLASSFENYTRTRSTHERTNWATLFSGGALLLALVVALGTGFVGVPLGNLTNTVKEMQGVSTQFRADALEYRRRHEVEQVRKNEEQDRWIEILRRIVFEDHADGRDKQ